MATTVAGPLTRWLAVVTAVVGVLVLGWLWLGSDEPERATLPTTSPSPAAKADFPSAARALVGDLEEAWRTGDATTAQGLASAGESRREVRALTRAIRQIGFAQLDLRYVTETGVSAGARDVQAPRTVTVQLTWRIRGLQAAASTVELPLDVAWNGEVVRIVDLRAEDAERAPLWLQEPTEVRRTKGALLVTTRPDADALADQIAEAVRTVRTVLPDWRGPLVVEAPSTSAEFEQASGIEAASAAAIAAVTTTVDTTSTSDSAVQVYLNPPVFDPLGPEGRQIVLSHEATHVAIDALRDPAPYWLSEGFADYVALSDTELPESVLAAQILALVREEGPPRRLPGRVEFDGANEDIGAWYEAAWLAARLIADQYGEEALLRFYDAAVEEREAAAFRTVLGLGKREFVADWSAYLAELAG